MPMSINGKPGARTLVANTAGTERIAPVVMQPGAGETLSSRLGITITLKTVGAQSNDGLLAMEYVAPPRFTGPAPHWHKETTEIFYVLEGALTVTAAGVSHHLGAGGYAFIPPGVVHGFGNETGDPVRFLCLASPAGLEHYFNELSELTKNATEWPPKDMAPIVALMAKYDSFAPSELE